MIVGAGAVTSIAYLATDSAGECSLIVLVAFVIAVVIALVALAIFFDRS